MAYLGQLLMIMVFFKVAAYTVNDNSTLMYFSTFVGRFDQFLVGMAAAMVLQPHRAKMQRHAPWLLVLAAFVVAGSTGWMHSVAPFGGAPKSFFWIWWSLLESVGWALFIVAWVSFRPKLPGAMERALCQGGRVSFSFYLLHMGVLHVLATKAGLVHQTGVAWLDAVLMFAVAYGITWALATISYSAIEEPFLRMRRRYGMKGAALPSVA
jgi:peptidoglycan/LPS O-acetylase OafA/YrhL